MGFTAVKNTVCLSRLELRQTGDRGATVERDGIALRTDSKLISRTRSRICREKGHWARECPNKRKQVPRDGEEVKTSFSVYFGGDHSTPGYIGKRVIDTGCSRFLIGQNTLEKWERMLTRRSGLSTQRVQLEKAMTFRLGNEKIFGNQDPGHTPCWNC